MTADPSPSVVRDLREGSAQAAETLDAAYREAMVRFAFSYLRDAEDAEDAVQEIFTKVLLAKEVPDDLRAWLYRIARNHCLNLVRSRGRRPDAARLPSNVDLAASMTGNLTRMMKEEEALRVAWELERLPEAQREVLVLRYTEDLSREEISQVVDQPVGVVKSRLYEGLKKLRLQDAD